MIDDTEEATAEQLLAHKMRGIDFTSLHAAELKRGALRERGTLCAAATLHDDNDNQEDEKEDTASSRTSRNADAAAPSRGGRRRRVDFLAKISSPAVGTLAHKVARVLTGATNAAVFARPSGRLGACGVVQVASGARKVGRAGALEGVDQVGANTAVAARCRVAFVNV